MALVVRRGVFLLPEDCWRIWPNQAPTLLPPSDFSVVFSFLARRLQPLTVPEQSERMAILRGAGAPSSALRNSNDNSSTGSAINPAGASARAAYANVSDGSQASAISDATVLEQPTPTASPDNRSPRSLAPSSPGASGLKASPGTSPLASSHRTPSDLRAEPAATRPIRRSGCSVDMGLPRGKRASKVIGPPHAKPAVQFVKFDMGLQGVFTFALTEV